VAHLYDPLHPAVLRLIAHIIRSADHARVPVVVCGEMAGDTLFTRLLLGFGLRQFSMYPTQLLTVKRQVLRSHLPDVIYFVKKILESDHPENTHTLLTKLNN
jgi:phosphotransferase system enzyme I (PtsI)